jgi:DUF2934 family protein
MAKEKSSSGESTLTKTKQSAARKTGSQSRLKVVASSDSASSTRWTEPTPAELDEEIRLRAYEFYCERGGGNGGHEDDWHRAEQEIREKYKYGT